MATPRVALAALLLLVCGSAACLAQGVAGRTGVTGVDEVPDQQLTRGLTRHSGTCSVARNQDATITLTPDASLTRPTYNADGSYERFDSPQVLAHFRQQLTPTMVSNRGTYSCVDARGDEQMLGTPGGDLAEIVTAIMAWHKIYKEVPTAAKVEELFNTFVSRIASRSRPIYFHTDDSRIRQLLQTMTVGGAPASILPNRGPTDSAEAAMWLNELAKSEYQGCGHIRLMLQKTPVDTSLLYSTRRTTANITDCPSAGDCIDSALVAEATIKAFFKYWWLTEPGSSQRANVRFSVDLGPLVGKAVVAVSTPAGAPDACKGFSPAVLPNSGGSSIFVYHGAAVGEWRTHVTSLLARAGAGWFKTSSVSQGTRSRFLAAWNALHNRQLGATLGNLPPANNIGLFGVEIPVGTASYGHHHHHRH